VPKNYKLKSAEELMRIAEKQNRKNDGTEPIDWAHEASIEDIKKFFCGDGPQKEPRPRASRGGTEEG